MLILDHTKSLFIAGPAELVIDFYHRVGPHYTA
jgi:hypothetical protein